MIVVCGSGIKTEPNTQTKVKRRRHDTEFKARVALQALKCAKTFRQIAKEPERSGWIAGCRPKVSTP